MKAVAPRHSSSDYASAFRSLLPTGPAWEEEHENLAATVEGLSSVFADPFDIATAAFLDQESDPRFTRQLLEDWERAFGLPDDCISVPQTIEDRINALLVRMTLKGGQSIPFFISVAKIIGYDISICEFAPFMAGVSRCGDTGPELSRAAYMVPPDMPLVLQEGLTTPPSSPVEGEKYILGIGCTGAWADQDQCLATWDGFNWQFASPLSPRIAGEIAVLKGQRIIKFDGANWQTVGEWTKDHYRWVIGPPEIRFYWVVYPSKTKLMWFRASSGRSGVDHHLEFSIAEDLECLLRRYKPAHTQIVFDYSDMIEITSPTYGA